MKRIQTIILSSLALSLAVIPFINKQEIKEAHAAGSASTLLFAHGTPGVDYFYNYCPSILEESDGTRHIYYCTNTVAGNVTDHIGYRKGTLSGSEYVWSDETIVLSPTSSTWDSRHTCDPSVIKGSFTYNSHTYSYLMAYLGCVTSDNSHNEIGIAVSDNPGSGWVKVNTLNPFYHFAGTSGYDGWEWGYGQPSLISIDKVGQVLFTYTVGEKTGTYINVEKWNLSNLNNPISLGKKDRVFTTGLLNNQASTDSVLNNVDFAYDEYSGRIYGIRDNHPNAEAEPTVATTSQLIYLSKNESDTSIGGNLFASSGTWNIVKDLTPAVTGLSRNHNSGLVRDEYGHLNNPSSIDVILTGGETGSDFWTGLSTYRLYSHKVNIGIANQDHFIDVSANITYNFTDPDQLATWKLLPDKADFSMGNAVAIRIRNNSGVDTPIRMSFNCTNDSRNRVVSNSDSSKLYYLYSLDGSVKSLAYRSWDGDIWLEHDFNGWLIMNKADQVVDTTYNNQGTFSWDSIYGIYFGIQTFYDSYADYDVGDVYAVNNNSTSFTFITHLYQSGLTTLANTKYKYVLDANGEGNINIRRNNSGYIPAIGFINKVELADSCSASFLDGYHSYSRILPYYNAIKDDPVSMDYVNNEYIYDYHSMDTTHALGKSQTYKVIDKWNAIVDRHTHKTYGSQLLFKNNRGIATITIIVLVSSLFMTLVISSIIKNKRRMNHD